MPTVEKIASVAEIKERLQEYDIAIATQYVGIKSEQVTALRKKLRDSDCEYKVYKNTLAKRALDELGMGEAAHCMEGPTAWAFSKDPVTPAKILKDFAKDSTFVKVRGGVLNGKPVTEAQLTALADLPPREVLLAMVVGAIAAPLSAFVGVLNAVPRSAVTVIDQIRKQKEEAGA